MRKLACAALYFAVAVSISHFFVSHENLLLFGGIAFVLSFSGLLFRGNNRLRIMIALFFLSVGFFWYFIFTAIYVIPYRYLHNEIETVVSIVTDYPVARQPRGYRVDASLLTNDQPSVGVRFYYSEEQDLKPGDVIKVTARFRRTDITDDGSSLDILSSKGIFLSANISGRIEIIESRPRLRYTPKIIANTVARMIKDIYPDDVSPFMQALLLGKRDDLYRDDVLSSSFSASGIIHIVSVSGMHISFLMSFLALVIRNKRLFALYGIPILFFYMAMTGFSPAVTRAGIMQIFLISAPLFGRERDSITSLSFAMFILLVINPYSCASAGMQLSFSATLGIIVFTSKINTAVTDSLRGNKTYRKKIPRTILNFVVSSLATTTGALIFTLPLTAIHFGYVSLIAPLTNLLTLGAVSFAFPAGLLATLSGFISRSIGEIAAYPVTIAARYIILIASSLASVPYSIIYSTNAHIMFWLAYIYVMFTALPLLKARLRQYLYPCCLALILLFTILLIAPAMPVVNNNSVTVLDVGQGMSVVITADDHIVVVDCGSSGFINAGETVHEFLLNLGRTSIDLLAITHFHSDHINGIEFLLTRMPISALAIPDPDGSFIAEDIIELARRRGTGIIYVTETLTFSLGDTDVFIYPPVGIGDENERGISVLTVGDVTALITGDMNSSTERSLLRFADLPKLDLLVVGHHGSRHSTSEELLYALAPDIAVIPVGRNSFGHPSPEVLERLERHGAAIFRTDESGHVTVYGG